MIQSCLTFTFTTNCSRSPTFPHALASYWSSSKFSKCSQKIYNKFCLSSLPPLPTQVIPVSFEILFPKNRLFQLQTPLCFLCLPTLSQILLWPENIVFQQHSNWTGFVSMFFLFIAFTCLCTWSYNGHCLCFPVRLSFSTPDFFQKFQIFYCIPSDLIIFYFFWLLSYVIS